MPVSSATRHAGTESAADARFNGLPYRTEVGSKQQRVGIASTARENAHPMYDNTVAMLDLPDQSIASSTQSNCCGHVSSMFDSPSSDASAVPSATSIAITAAEKVKR
jgi:hypothetical protein